MCNSFRGPKIVSEFMPWPKNSVWINQCQGVEHPGFLVLMSSKAWNGPSPFTLEVLGYSRKQLNLKDVGLLSMVILMVANILFIWYSYQLLNKKFISINKVKVSDHLTQLFIRSLSTILSASPPPSWPIFSLGLINIFWSVTLYVALCYAICLCSLDIKIC